jgi:hypothetical protein
MLKRFAVLGVVAALSLVGGCRTFTSPARSHGLPNNVTWMDYDATRRGVLLVTDGTGTHIISEPSPDAALGVVSEFVAKASYNGISAEGSAKVTESIAELGKRTQTVMFLRECMYRLNELEANHIDLASKPELVKLYTQVINAAVELAAADAKDSEKSKEVAAEAASNAKTRENVAEAVKSNAVFRQLQAVTKDVFGEDVNSKLLQDFWMPNGNQPDPAHQKELEDWMDRNGLDKRTIQLMISGGMFGDVRRQAVKDLGLPR